MTDFSSLQTKINDLKAKVSQNSISPLYLGALLEDFIAVIMEDDSKQAMAKVNLELQKIAATASEAKSTADDNLDKIEKLRQNLEKALSLDSSDQIESLNEVLAFLDGIKDTETLAATLIKIKESIINNANDASNKLAEEKAVLDRKISNEAISRALSDQDIRSDINIWPFDGILEQRDQAQSDGTYFISNKGAFETRTTTSNTPEWQLSAGPYNSNKQASQTTIFRNGNRLYKAVSLDGAIVLLAYVDELNIEDTKKTILEQLSALDNAVGILPFDGLAQSEQDASVYGAGKIVYISDFNSFCRFYRGQWTPIESGGYNVGLVDISPVSTLESDGAPIAIADTPRPIPMYMPNPKCLFRCDGNLYHAAKTESGYALEPFIDRLQFITHIENRMPEKYISVESIDALLTLIGKATGGTWSRTWNEDTSTHTFTFNPPDEKFDQTKIGNYSRTAGGRNLTSFTLHNEKDISGGKALGDVTFQINQPTTLNRSLFYDKTDQVPFVTRAGNTVKFSEITLTGDWIHGYLFIDYNNDGGFNSRLNTGFDLKSDDPRIAEALNPSETGELVSFNYFDVDKSTPKDDYFVDSHGKHVTPTGDSPSPSNMPAFIIPSWVKPGIYNALYKHDWSNISQHGNPGDAEGQNSIDSNGGVVVKFRIKVVA